ncbi:macrophage mannose receptor 1 [Octopus bimaculoides]|uniref:C-type lectin domain-containing protein n=1 Tax=Octopus bimaculoides TaxID=37653 RepID=A0A0L8FQV0_OCTBM|nr:macrophage mannose receptor 1 [Octopus bimaculoides]|eukprot:XP_014787715.1 PREDICTED: macrophage mannose receptor 1-like [Octopus bimaculoides]
MDCFSVWHVIRKANLHVITFPILLFQICLGSNVTFREYYGIRVPLPLTSIPEDDKIIQMSNISSEIECFSHCITYSKCGMIIYSVSDELCILRKIMLLPDASSSINIPANSIYTMLQAPECPTSAGYTYQPELRLCYQIGSTKASWNEAADNCNKDRGQLIHIKNQEIMNYLKSILLSSTLRNEWFHFGLCKDDSKNAFVWQNGEALTFSSWSPGCPDNYRNSQKCADLDPMEDYGWNDIFCDQLKSGIQICEIVVQ